MQEQKVILLQYEFNYINYLVSHLFALCRYIQISFQVIFRILAFVILQLFTLHGLKFNEFYLFTLYFLPNFKQQPEVYDLRVILLEQHVQIS
jgi:hypothetical protein